MYCVHTYSYIVHVHIVHINIQVAEISAELLQGELDDNTDTGMYIVHSTLYEYILVQSHSLTVPPSDLLPLPPEYTESYSLDMII